MHSITRVMVLALFAGALVAAGCSNDQSTPVAPSGSFTKAPAAPAFPGVEAFVEGIDNPYLAFAPGKVFRYESETDEGLETIEVEVTSLEKTVMGVKVTVVHDVEKLNGELVEDTFDWFAQDEDGNVWYFGEDSKSYHDGEVSTEGSWEAGVNGEPGIIMLANPTRGMKYAQEEAPGIAEDMAQVKKLDVSVDVEYGSFDECLQIAEWNPLESGSREYKYYKPGIGLVMEAEGGKQRVELVDIED